MSRKKAKKEKFKEAKNMNENIEEVVEEPVEEVVEEPVEEVVEEPVEEVVEEPVEEVVEEPVEDGGDASEEVFGYVIPSKLNVRVEPDKDATILMVIDKDKEVIVDGEQGDFLRVVVDGNVGYCMKNFIAIK